MNSVRQNTTLCNGSLLKFNMKTKNPVGTLDVHYPRFASVLSRSLPTPIKAGRFPLAQNSQNSVVRLIACHRRILLFCHFSYELITFYTIILYNNNICIVTLCTQSYAVIKSKITIQHVITNRLDYIPYLIENWRMQHYAYYSNVLYACVARSARWRKNLLTSLRKLRPPAIFSQGAIGSD